MKVLCALQGNPVWSLCINEGLNCCCKCLSIIGIVTTLHIFESVTHQTAPYIGSTGLSGPTFS